MFCSVFLVLTFLSSITFGQIKKELNKKLYNIEGTAEKISIQTDKGAVNFTGKEAEEFLENLENKDNVTIDIDYKYNDSKTIIIKKLKKVRKDK